MKLVYTVCVIGTISWHEVITCEHDVSVDQKCFHQPHIPHKSCTVFISMHFFHEHICFFFPLLFFSFFLVDTLLKEKTASLLELVNNTLIHKSYINYKKMPSQIQSVHVHIMLYVHHVNLQKSLLRFFFFCTLNQNPGVNARILYYKKTTRLVKRTAEYKTTSIINVFT